MLGGGAGGGRPLVTTLTSSSGVTVTMGEIKEELCEALALAQQRQYEAQRDLSPLYNNLIDRAARTGAGGHRNSLRARPLPHFRT